MAIGQKQSISHEQFLEAWARIEELVPRSHAEDLVQKAAVEVEKVTAGKRVAFSWSGGKDSLALEVVCKAAGVGECMMAITDLEVPRFLAWVTDHMPHGMEVRNVGLDLAWLASHPTFLFPDRNKDGPDGPGIQGTRWFNRVQRKGQVEFFRERGLDMLLLGRRRKDGNWIPRQAGLPDGVFVSRGVTWYAPIRDWTHEETFAVIHYGGLQLPPVYDWPRGFRVGTGPWPQRQWCDSIEQGWEETYKIDPAIVREAAYVIPSGMDFLTKHGLL